MSVGAEAVRLSRYDPAVTSILSVTEESAVAYGQPPYPYAPPPAPIRPWWQTSKARLAFIGAAAITMAIVEGLGVLLMFASIALIWISTGGLRHPWKVWQRIAATVGTLLLCLIVAGIAHPVKKKDDAKPAAAPTAAATSKAPATPAPAAAPQLGDYAGKALSEARKGAEAAGYTVGNRDASNESREVVLAGNWTVCFQKISDLAEGKKGVDFSVVKEGEPCPKEDGGALPWPVMPNAVGATYNKAVADLKAAGVPLERVKLEDVYLDTDTPTAEQAAKDGEEWHVCFQDPGKDGKVTSTTTVRLDLGRWSDASLVKTCPAAKGTTYQIPANDPDYKRPEPSGGDDDSSSQGGSTGGGAKTVHPGAFCSPAGAVGTANGKTYTCKGPGQNRWRQ
ncbi:hypothetical protein [Streptomyces sp. NPDC056544]|uniref:hypothetical protein n=1 Tax=unclassified Streptomyces TaxID=2593676 RepID=UPI0036ABA1EC